MIRTMTAGAAALAMLATPMAASAAPARAQGAAKSASASALSLSPATRAGTSGKRTTKLGQQGAVIAGVLALGVVAGGVILVSRDDDDGPNSN